MNRLTQVIRGIEPNNPIINLRRTMQLPETWAWDEHDMLVTAEDEVAARHAKIIVDQVESLDLEDQWATTKILSSES